MHRVRWQLLAIALAAPLWPRQDRPEWSHPLQSLQAIGKPLDWTLQEPLYNLGRTHLPDFLYHSTTDDADHTNLRNVNITSKFRRLRDKYSAPQYPIVLCHGLSGFDTWNLLALPQALWNPDYEPVRDMTDDESGVSVALLVDYWNGIERALTAAGAQVITARVPPFGAIEERARALDALLEQQCAHHPARRPGERLKLNLVGHSMGGLDARYLISKVQTRQSAYEVVSLTTVGTPHHGSECADFVVEMAPEVCPRAVEELTTAHLARFNAAVPDDPAVHYFSYGALMDPRGLRLFRPTYEIIRRRILAAGGNPENDGMVSVELAQWGEYVGTLEGVDHLDLINWTNRARAMVDQIVFKRDPAFNAVALYLDIAETLSRRGF